MSKESINIDFYVKQFGINLKKIRESKNMTQLDLATAMNELSSEPLIDKTTVSRIENGRTNITLTTSIKLSLALEIELKTLFDLGL
ncbi:transcriptional regulator with XRE-family HTH domain [Flavobacterium sp. 2755]|uniref:helix-turn-helix domain-containing protein n=1 Tax=Flavobacterium sp. 2755 TaxID=2817765 RepID=UPI002861BA89|nr:helix-turn-helix transcriptional regulator [Flavobacterium sp. 2755]MDR6761823.1 transcriptional regulator with XRE-family HTH domain [Flavobacterium sp. 2755]